MNPRDLTDLTNFGEESKSFEELRKEAEVLLARYREMLRPKEAGASTTEHENTHDTSTCVSEHPDEKVEDVNGATPEKTQDLGTDVFGASLEALLLTLRQPCRETDACDFSDNDENDSKEDSQAIVRPDGNGSDTESLDSSVTAGASALPEAPPRVLENDEVPAEPDARPVQETKSILASALRALRASKFHPPSPDSENGPASGEEAQIEETLSDDIPSSASEELPKYEAPEETRICTECGCDTKLANECCENCSWIDRSLGILDAVISGDLNQVELLLRAKPRIIVTRTSGHEWTLLHMAASGGNPKMVELLISKGAQVNALTTDDKTPLHYAAGKGHLEIARTLVGNDADVTLVCNGKTALDLAKDHGRDEVIDFLQNATA
ncbi:MAG: ankyrin repeat domain-containing protein [Candidatus Hydrogenedentes bacterium]|nr:ankyrin repeat domain-containing protein [Candidatus Hydrogenedentota bacterium]